MKKMQYHLVPFQRLLLAVNHLGKGRKKLT